MDRPSCRSASLWAGIVLGVLAGLSTSKDVVAGMPKLPGIYETTPTWDELSKQVIPKLIEKNWDIGSATRFARKASCKIHVQFSMKADVTTRPISGVVNYMWEDHEGDGYLRQNEIRVKPEQTPDLFAQAILKDACSELVKETLCSLNNVFLFNHVKTAKTPGGYQITLRPLKNPHIVSALGYAQRVLTVGKDLRVAQVRIWDLTGAQTILVPKCQATGGRWVWASASRRPVHATTRGGEAKTFSYVERHGMPVLTAMAVSSSYSPKPALLNVTSQKHYRFTDWKFEKRPQPLPPPTPPKPPKPEPLPPPPPIKPGVIPPPEPRD